MSEFDDQATASMPVWPVFGDLMSGLVGVFVLLLVWVLGFQLELAQTLRETTTEREAESARRQQLEAALAQPLANGRITFEQGRIGISGNLLFDTNSSELQAGGLDLLQDLVEPLRLYLNQEQQVLMVSGFTDAQPIQVGNAHYSDNWELSAQRALTVTRALIAAGVPADGIFAAAFGAQQPVAPNTDAAGRARNRRVEIAPISRADATASAKTAQSDLTHDE